MASPRLEVVLDDEGRYLDANPSLLDLLGYSVDELRALSLGAIGTAAPGSVAETWVAFVRGEIDMPDDRRAELRRKDGSLVPTWFVGAARGDRAGTWVVAFEPLTQPLPVNIPPVLPVILSRWRAAERRLAQLAADDPQRPVEEARVEELRRLYQLESRRR
jgi:PAS domain-containing protein